MAARNEKVMAMVEEELQKNPSISNEDLFEKAKKIDRGIGQLTSRQFNARYPLQIKRKQSAGKPRRGRGRVAARAGGRRRGRGAAAEEAARNAVRDVMWDFAADVAKADEKGQLVGLLKGVDRYVDRVLKASGKK
jgi:hypothetical protein